MKIDSLLTQFGEWLKGGGKEGDVVVSSRVRLARNLYRFPFLTVATPAVRAEIENYVKEHLEVKKMTKKLYYFELGKLEVIDKQLLVERHLISREHATGANNRGVAISQDESISIMVNEEDHLRLQVLRAGFHFDEAWEELDRIDTAFESLGYAFSPQFGYLTACPTNVGTALRVSVMIHIPALVFTNQVDKVMQSLSRINFAVRGLFGEGSTALGDFYQISNQQTLGKSESDIINEMKNILPQIINYERTWREKLMDEQKTRLEDKVWRAYGILKNARVISTNEALELLSALRLGINLEIIKDIEPKTLNELFIFTQPSHLQKLQARHLEPQERDMTRAEFIRQKLAKNN